MKLTIIITCVILSSLTTFGQTNYRISDEIEKSASITDAQMLDPGFEDFIVFWMRQGATTFNQEGYLVKIDRKTLKVQEKVAVELDPTLKNSYGEYAIAGQKTIYLPSYVTNKASNTLDMYCYKLGKNLTTNKAPTKCFSGPKPSSTIKVYQNEKKDLLTFAYIEKKRKEKKDVYHCHVLDQDLNEVFATTMDRPYAEKNTSFGYLVYNQGVVYIDPKDRSTLNVMDVKTSQLHEIKLTTGKTLTIESVKEIANGNIIICGTYYTEKSNRAEGTYRAEINSRTDELVRFDEHSLKKMKNKKYPFVTDVLITDEGDAYFVSSVSISTSSSDIRSDYQAHYISKDGDSWSKNLPIPKQVLPAVSYAQTIDCRLFYNNGNLCLVYNDSKKAIQEDANNYNVGDKIGTVSLAKPKGLISLLKVDKKGVIKRKSFETESGEFVNGDFCTNGSILYSPARKIKGIVYGKSRVLEFDFSKF